MKIVNVEFNEVVKGMYISEDGKGLLIEMFDLTGLEKSADLAELSAEVILRIEECAEAYADKIEGIIFDNRNYWEVDLGGGFVLDLETLCSLFPNLKTVACGGGEYYVTDYPDELRFMNERDFWDLAKNAYNNGDVNKAEECFEWGKIVDYYDCMYDYALWLSRQGKIAEAEECYKFITGEKDKYGVANNSYAYLLDGQGRHSEAQEYFRYVSYGRSYKDAKELADVFLYDQHQDENSPYWKNLCLEELNNGIRDYVDACKENGKVPDIERILLNASDAEGYHSSEAEVKLIQIYGTGKYVFECGDVIDVPGFPNLDKFQALASKTYESPILRALYLDFIENWECEEVGELCEDEIKTLENALLTIEVGRAILFWLYYVGEYHSYESGTLRFPQLIDMHKAAKLLGEDSIWDDLYECACYLEDGDHCFSKSEYHQKRLEVLEEAYKLYPESVEIVKLLLDTLLEIGDINRFVEVLRSASREFLERWVEWQDWGWRSLLRKCKDIKTAEELEKYLLVMLEHASELGDEWDCAQAEEMLFWLYYTGAYQWNDYGTSIELKFPQLLNLHKAAELMGRKELWTESCFYEDFGVYDGDGENLRTVLEEAYKLYPDNEYVVSELLRKLIDNDVDIDRLVEVLQVAPKAAVRGFVNTESEMLCEMCCWLEDETLEKYILAIIEYCSDVESEWWDIREWKRLMLTLYKTGYSAEWGEEPIDAPSLKDEGKAAAFAEKYGAELSDDDADED